MANGRKLTIGMVVYDDWDGFYFSIQAIRMYHKEILDDVEFVVINTNPSSPQGKSVKDFCNAKWVKEPLQYFDDDNAMGTATRSKIFDYARTPYVLVMDSHVMLETKSIKKLIDYFDSGKDDENLLQGPLLYDHLQDGPSYFKREWRGGMHGTWAMDERSKSEDSFEIPAQGLGVFACRKNSWLGFEKGHRGFGGEENFISDKFRANNKKVICLGFLKWLHRFSRPSGTSYPNKYEDRVKNYFRGHLELDQPVFEIIEHFKTLNISEETLRTWLLDVIKENAIS